MPSRAPGAVPDREGLEHDREAPLEDFRVGRPGVGHVGVHGAGAVEFRPGARAAADRLVVLVFGVVAEREIVHGALAGAHQPERAQQGCW